MGNCNGICSHSFIKIKADILIKEKNYEKIDISSFDINKLKFYKRQ